MARSTFYYYLKSERKNKYEQEEKEIVSLFEANKGRYGYRRILSELRAKGYAINHKTVLKLMQKLGLKGKQRKNEKYHSYKGEIGKIADNLLKRDFHADNPLKNLQRMLLSSRYAMTRYTFLLSWIFTTRDCFVFHFSQS